MQGNINVYSRCYIFLISLIRAWWNRGHRIYWHGTEMTLTFRPETIILRASTVPCLATFKQICLKTPRGQHLYIWPAVLLRLLTTCWKSIGHIYSQRVSTLPNLATLKQGGQNILSEQHRPTCILKKMPPPSLRGHTSHPLLAWREPPQCNFLYFFCMSLRLCNFLRSAF